MPQPETQAEIVERDQLRRGDFEEITEKIYLPGLTNLFTITQASSSPLRNDNLRLPNLEALPGASRFTIADTLVELLFRKRNIITIDWQLGNSTLDIKGKEGTINKCSLSQEDLTEKLVNLLKSRSNITRIRWTLSNPYIELSYRR